MDDPHPQTDLRSSMYDPQERFAHLVSPSEGRMITMTSRKVNVFFITEWCSELLEMK